MITDKLAGSTWNHEDYYDQAKSASENEHPSLSFLKNRYVGKEILEVACGEGTKLANLNAKKRVGLDISEVAIKRAKLKLDTAIVGNAEALPFKDNQFDAVLSFFSLEHFESPEIVMQEMIRVASVGAEIVILTPNFGASNRSSPCFKGSRLVKLIKGFVKDFVPHQSKLGWNHVTPLSIEHSYESDFDTVVEPYISTLIQYLKYHKLDIVVATSNWEVSLQNEGLVQKVFRFLGTYGVYPFSYWGPHAFVIARKTK